jgi:hypothetical protein
MQKLSHENIISYIEVTLNPWDLQLQNLFGVWRRR